MKQKTTKHRGGKRCKIIYLDRTSESYNANALTTRMIYTIKIVENIGWPYEKGEYSVKNVFGSKYNGRYRFMYNFTVLSKDEEDEEYTEYQCYRFERIGSGETLDIIECRGFDYSGFSIIDMRHSIYSHSYTGDLVPVNMILERLSDYVVLADDNPMVLCIIREYVDPEDMKNVSRVVNRKYKGKHSDIKTHIKTFLTSSSATKRLIKR